MQLRANYVATISIYCYESSAHLFSARIASSSSGDISLTILNRLRISSGVLPLIMALTLQHAKSNIVTISIINKLNTQETDFNVKYISSV